MEEITPQINCHAIKETFTLGYNRLVNFALGQWAYILVHKKKAPTCVA